MAYSTQTLKNQIRDIIFDHAGLEFGGLKLDDDTDLYKVGMKSFASVQLMLALEDEFDIEFPDAMLKRTTFRSPAAIETAVQSLSKPSEPWSARSPVIGGANAPHA
jgi:acyl carrier protein